MFYHMYNLKMFVNMVYKHNFYNICICTCTVRYSFTGVTPQREKTWTRYVTFSQYTVEYQ